MLLKENYTAEHILKLRKQTGNDPSIIERTVFAFGLLEAIASVGLPFIFKGGTSLLILLDKPRRLSTDIDIIVSPGTDVDDYINKASSVFPFISVQENVRKGLNNIEKRHFRFCFISPVTNKEINVLLDVVFEDDPYIKLDSCYIRNDMLLSSGEDYAIKIPNKNCVLGDKLTAFAPHTTGIPFKVNKELEIIKQMFDCWTLLNEMDDFETVYKTYMNISKLEIAYRGLNINYADCLKDTIDSCICIMARGSVRKDDYDYFSLGINALRGHVFNGVINGESSVVYASELMYLASCMLTQQDSYEYDIDQDEYRNNQLRIKGIKKVSSMKNVNPRSYAYMIKSFQLLNKYGMYLDDISI